MIRDSRSHLGLLKLFIFEIAEYLLSVAVRVDAAFEDDVAFECCEDDVAFESCV